MALNQYVRLKQGRKASVKQMYSACGKHLKRGSSVYLFPEFAKAVISALEAIIDENPGKRVAVACHGGVINVWTSHVIGFEPKMFFNPNYTSINRFMAASSGEKSVVSLNEHHHLKP